MWRNSRRELREAFAKHPIERGERMDDVGECLQRSARSDCQHELPDDFAGTRSDERCADQCAAVAIADELQYAPVEVVDIASRALGRIAALGRDELLARATG